MRVLVMVKANKDSEAGIRPKQKLLAEMTKFNEELVKAGVLLAAEGLQPSSKGKRVRFSGQKRRVIDGPFTETKELVGGYSVYEVKAKQEAIEWTYRFMQLFAEHWQTGECEAEIRQILVAPEFNVNQGV